MAKGVDDLIADFKGAINEVETIVSRSLNNNKEPIYDLARDRLSRNEYADGSAIGYYNRAHNGSYNGYTGYSSFPKRRGDPYNMNWSGELFDSFTHKYSNGIMIVYNSRADELSSSSVKNPYKKTLGHFSDDEKIIINNFVTKDLNEWMGNL